MDIRLVVEQGGRRRQVYRMRTAEMVVGRKGGCGLRIPSAQVSRQHCRLRRAQGFVVLEDLGSINGTVLNGQRVQGTQALRPGDRLQIGPVMFVVEYELTADALDRLMAWESGGTAAGSVPELELASDEETPTLTARLDDPNAALPMEDAGLLEGLALPMEDAVEEVFDGLPVPARQRDELPLPLAEEDDLPELELAGDAPMHLPADEELRDFLTQLEEPAED